MDETAPSSPRASRGIERAASRWLARQSLGTLGEDERAEFEDWLCRDPAHFDAFERLSGTLSALDGSAAVVREADRRARTAARKNSVRRTGAALTLACLALAGTLAATDFRAEFADLKTGRGERRAIALADGSRLVLDADSAADIDYGTGERRIALLRGRLHVEVRHGDARPFRVAALGGVAQDVGTGFDVSLQGDGALAVVTQGEILARSGGRDLPLHKDQAARWSADGAPRPLFEPPLAEASAWRYGRLVFDERPFSEVLGTLDRYAGKPIWLWNRAAAGRKVSGVVRAEGVDASLASLVRAQGLKVRNIGVAWVVY
ncbi:MAG: FecR domain-containing protein [Candidatus Andeanibacterium colombiense]|uniref:FecR domain-containing protein n=1 Tax=Candidatus Andeanibacterium colombiense TaxID=3121345 RepID=A0AAJ6BRA2_9SPHN|nr:MAG: FecR domain-containing protein [Sphingomonadaceae bacterium]